MGGPMRKPEWMGRLRRQAGAGLRLGPWLLLSLLLVLVMWQGEPTALAGLFQSPPIDTPTGTSEASPSGVPTATWTPAITGTPGITGTPTILPSDTPTVLPSDTPTAALSETRTVTDTQLLPADAEEVTPAPTAEGETAGQVPQRYAEGESNLRFEWGMLFDAVALGLSYVWLCCGALIVLGVPLFFLVLWVASRRRQRAE